MKAAAALALDGVGNGDGPMVVHLDVDVIDKAQMPARGYHTPGEGLSLEEASDLLTGILASPRVVALEVCEYDPDYDDAGLTAGRRLVEIVSRAVARRLANLAGRVRSASATGRPHDASDSRSRRPLRATR